MATSPPTPSYPIPYTLELDALKQAISGLLDKIKTQAQTVNSNDNASIDRDNVLTDAITDTYARIRSVELVVNNYQEVLGLTPEQVATISEAAGYLIDADGNATTLGTLIDRMATFTGVTDALQSAIDAVNTALVDKVGTTAFQALNNRVQALEGSPPDLSGLPTHADMQALYSSTATAIGGIADALTNAAVEIKALVSGFSFPAHQHMVFQAPNASASGLTNSGGAPL